MPQGDITARFCGDLLAGVCPALPACCASRSRRPLGRVISGRPATMPSPVGRGGRRECSHSDEGRSVVRGLLRDAAGVIAALVTLWVVALLVGLAVSAAWPPEGSHTA